MINFKCLMLNVFTASAGKIKIANCVKLQIANCSKVKALNEYNNLTFKIYHLTLYKV